MVSLFIQRHVTVYFDSFGIEYIPQEVLNKIKDKSITTTYLEHVTMILAANIYCYLINYQAKQLLLFHYTNSELRAVLY